MLSGGGGGGGGGKGAGGKASAASGKSSKGVGRGRPGWGGDAARDSRGGGRRRWPRRPRPSRPRRNRPTPPPPRAPPPPRDPRRRRSSRSSSPSDKQEVLLDMPRCSRSPDKGKSTSRESTPSTGEIATLEAGGMRNTASGRNPPPQSPRRRRRRRRASAADGILDSLGPTCPKKRPELSPQAPLLDCEPVGRTRLRLGTVEGSPVESIAGTIEWNPPRPLRDSAGDIATRRPDVRGERLMSRRRRARRRGNGGNDRLNEMMEKRWAGGVRTGRRRGRPGDAEDPPLVKTDREQQIRQLSRRVGSTKRCCFARISPIFDVGQSRCVAIASSVAPRPSRHSEARARGWEDAPRRDAVTTPACASGGRRPRNRGDAARGSSVAGRCAVGARCRRDGGDGVRAECDGGRGEGRTRGDARRRGAPRARVPSGRVEPRPLRARVRRRS